MKLDDTQLLALCIYGETGKRPVTGPQLGIAWCVMNRLKVLNQRVGEVTLRSVVLSSRQFPCFKEGNPNRLGLMAIACGWDKAFQRNKHLRECYRIAEGVMNGDLPDNVSGAIHYRRSKDQAPWPEAKELVAVIGDYEFYA
jgi:hypothetical protein